MITPGYELATDPAFRELSNFITPPRAGKVTAIEGSGQVRVDTDDPDGGDVLAWPLNDFVYSVDDVVYVQFGVNNPDSAIVLGSKGATPTLPSYIRRSGADTLTSNWDIGEDRAILLEKLAARDNEGITIVDDAGNVIAWLRDGGNAVFGEGGTASNSTRALNIIGAAATLRVLRITADIDTAAPAVELIHRTTADGANNAYWDMYASSDGLSLRDRVANLNRLTLPLTGGMGVGVLVPQGWMHGHDGVGGFLFVTKTGVVGSAVTLIPSATGDVTKSCYCLGIITNSTPTNFTVATKIDNGANQNFNDGAGNTLQLAVAANGALTAQRTLGAATWALTLFLVWQ